MSDGQVKQFRTRLKRIDKIHRRGGGFEATGTLGQSYYTRMARKGSRSVMRPALALVFGVLAFKAIAAASMDPAAYEARVTDLATGSVAEQAGAFVMSPDPISGAVAGWIAPLFD